MIGIKVAQMIYSNRVLEVDALRGIAAMGVMFLHYQSAFTGGHFMQWATLFVDLFFVLSGYVLARTYEAKIRNGDINFGGFIRRRIARMLPMHYVGLFSMLIIAGLYIMLQGRNILTDNDTAYTFLLNLLLLNHVGLLPGQSWNVVSWSISVELVVNVIWFAAVRCRFDRTWLIATLWASILGFFLTITPTVMDVTEPNYFGGYVNGGILRCMLSFSAGVLIARKADIPLRGRWVIPLNTIAVLCVASFALLQARYRAPGFPGLDYFEVAIIFPLLVLASINGNSFLSAPLRMAPLTFLGTISFSIYILHRPIDFLWSVLGLPQNVPWYGWRLVLVTLIVSAIAYYWIEKPLRRVINRAGRANQNPFTEHLTPSVE